MASSRLWLLLTLGGLFGSLGAVAVEFGINHGFATGSIIVWAFVAGLWAGGVVIPRVFR